MKISFIISACLLILAGPVHACPIDFIRSATNSTDLIRPDTIPPENRFTVEDAEKILGEKARAGEDKTEINAISQSFTKSYSALTGDTKTGRTGNLWVIFEHYNKVEEADAKYDEMLASNRNSPGVKILSNIGDEAWWHSDGTNFYLIIIRKGNRMFRMKVNRVTSKTSVEEFNRYARKVAETL